MLTEDYLTMNLYTRYQMRSCGERNYQPSGNGEVAAFTAVSMIKQNEKLKAGFDAMSEAEKNAFMEEIVRVMDSSPNAG